MGADVLVEDHEGNWCLSTSRIVFKTYKNELIPFMGMPPIGIPMRWVRVYMNDHGIISTSCGYFIKDSDIFGDFDDNQPVPTP